MDVEDERKRGDAPQEQSELHGLREALMHFNLDRKLMPEKLIKNFDLPEGSERLGKFTCTLGNAIGQLHVTTFHLCFLGALGKKLLVPLADVASIARAKRFKLTPGAGHSLHIIARSSTYELHGFHEREVCLKTICKACDKAHGKLPAVTDRTSP